jgi:hypothetical protein
MHINQRDYVANDATVPLTDVSGWCWNATLLTRECLARVDTLTSRVRKY